MITVFFDFDVLTETSKATFCELCGRMGWEPCLDSNTVALPPTDAILYDFVTEGLR